MIYFHVPKAKGEGIFIRTIQDTFPLFDCAALEESKKKHLLLISFKLNGEFILSKHKIDEIEMDFEDYFVHYYQTYTTLAKKQFGEDLEVSMLYIIYKDKKTAQNYFQSHERLKNQAYFMEFGELKKSYPTEFLLKENLI